MLNLAKCLLMAETFALIYWQALDVVVVVYSFSMHKKRHTMISVKAVQRETTVYAYCG